MSRTTQIIIALLIVDMLGASLLWYGYTGMQDKKTEEYGLQKDLSEESNKNQKMILLRSSLDAAEPDRKILEQYLFDSSDENLIKFISQMEQLGLKTTGALVETRSLDRSGASVHGEFVITGSWSQLFHFLRLVEEIPTRVVVNRFDIRRTDTPGSPGKESVESWGGSISIDITSLRSQ